MRVYLHAGHFKTGTTSFQHLLADNKELLAEQSVYVPEFRNGNHGYRLGINRDTGRNESGLAAELQQAKQSGYKSAIISAEVVSHFGPREYQNLRQIFSGLELTFVLVLRPWQGFLVPRFKQNIKRGDYQTLAAYLEQLAVEGDRHPDTQYGLIVDRALEHFSSDVMVLEYEADAAPRAIFKRIGLESSQAEGMIKNAATMNVSQKWEEVESYRVVNAIVGSTVGWRPDRKAMQAVSWTQEIKIFRTSTFVNLIKRNEPKLYDGIGRFAGQSSKTLNMSLLEPHIERWAASLKKHLEREGVSHNLSNRFFECEGATFNYLEADIDQLDSEIRADVLRAFEKYRPQLA